MAEVRVLDIGKVYGIVKNIDSDKYTDEEKGTAIMQMLKMETHMGIFKKDLMKIAWYLLEIAYDLPEDIEKPNFKYD